jgi:cysteine desulfurase
MPAYPGNVSAYLDYAATAPMRPVARQAWLAHADGPANPASLHGSGRQASRVLEDAREQVAGLAGVSPAEVLFSSGGTESDAIAVRGLFRGGRVLVGATEHKAVLDAVRALPGAQVEVLPVDPEGALDLAAFQRALAVPADFVAVMGANNETGTVHDVAAIGELCRRAAVPWHCDAVQWPATRDLAEIGADTIAVSAHKLGGPVGVGALIMRRGTDLAVYSHGGVQEAGIRSGTVDVAGIAAFAAAWQEAADTRRLQVPRIARLRDDLAAGIAATFPGAVVRGGTGADRLASHLHVTFPGCAGDALLMLLDAAGVEVSTGSACTAGIPQPSHVLLAMGAGQEAAQGSLRFSLGWASTEQDVDAALAALPAAVERAERAGVLR